MTILPKVTTKEQFNKLQTTPEYQQAVEQLLAKKRGVTPGTTTSSYSSIPPSSSTSPIVLEGNALGYLGSDEYKNLKQKFLDAKRNGEDVSGIQAQARQGLTKLGVNTMTGQDLTPIKGMDAYTEDARQQYEPTYNQRVQLLKNQMAQNITNLENSKLGVNQNFDQQIMKNNRYIKSNQNRFSNMTLGRGLGRSTIATSGIGEMSNIGARMNDETNFKRTQELGNIDNKIATEQNNTNNRLTQMEIDKQDQIAALAKQMMKEDKEEQWKQRLHQDEMFMHKIDMGHDEKMQEKRFTHDFDIKDMEQKFAKDMEADRQAFEKDLQKSKNDFMREMKNLDISEAEKERKWKEIQAQKERDFQATQNEKNRANQVQLAKMQIAAQKSYSRSGGGGGYYRSYSGGGGRRYYSGGYKKSGGGRFDEASELMKMYLKAESSLGHLPAAKPQITNDLLVYKNPKPGTPLAPWAKKTIFGLKY